MVRNDPRLVKEKKVEKWPATVMITTSVINLEPRSEVEGEVGKKRSYDLHQLPGQHGGAADVTSASSVGATGG